MNKRIKELAEQAYEQQPLMIVNPQTYELEHKIGNGGVPMYHRVFNQEKFAELIVKECHMLAVGNASWLPKDVSPATGMNDVFKKYFGVEE